MLPGGQFSKKAAGRSRRRLARARVTRGEDGGKRGGGGKGEGTGE